MMNSEMIRKTEEFLKQHFDNATEFEQPVGTETAGEMWKAKIDFAIGFFRRLAEQLEHSQSVMVD